METHGTSGLKLKAFSRDFLHTLINLVLFLTDDFLA